MTDLVAGYLPIFDLMLVGAGYALSQYLFLRAGSFSVATAGLAGVGAYASALIVTRMGWGLVGGLIVGTLGGMVVAAVLAAPLAKLRGVYQAIATIAFVEIVHSGILLAEGLTGGASGLNGIPKLAGTLHLLVAVAFVYYVLHALGRTALGRAWDAIREDEAVAVSLGVNVARHHYVAFAASGAIAGLFGALEALSTYALSPNQFGFALLVAALSYVVLGGRKRPLGPILGAVVLVLLPEVSRGFADFRLMVYGMLLIIVINYLPKGIVDTLADGLGRRASARHTQEAGTPKVSTEGTQ